MEFITYAIVLDYKPHEWYRADRSHSTVQDHWKIIGSMTAALAQQREYREEEKMNR